MRRPGMTEVVAGVRDWASGRPVHVRAAVELLIVHGVWMRRQEFLDMAVVRTVDGWYVSFPSARIAFDAGEFARASDAEIGVLDFAIALGSDRFEFGRMAGAGSDLVVKAIRQTLESGDDGGDPADVHRLYGLPRTG